VGGVGGIVGGELLVHKRLKHGEGKGERFAAAGLSRADDVGIVVDGGREAVLLDGEGLREAHGGKGALKGLVQSEGFPSGGIARAGAIRATWVGSFGGAGLALERRVGAQAGAITGAPALAGKVGSRLGGEGGGVGDGVAGEMAGIKGLELDEARLGGAGKEVLRGVFSLAPGQRVKRFR
jgi:hypothetical protein